MLLFCSMAALQAQDRQTSIVIAAADAGVDSPHRGKLTSPFGVDFDAAGNMYIVELGGGRVHTLDTRGRFTTIAGDGSKSFSGDGGPAQSATFNGMHNVAVTPAGDVYISDSWNHCIRRIDANTGIITTIAGTGEAGVRRRRRTRDAGAIRLSDVHHVQRRP